jgi:hypothetical protein
MYFLNLTITRGLQISLLLYTRDKFYLDVLASHFMIHGTSKNFFCNYLGMEQNLIA